MDRERFEPARMSLHRLYLSIRKVSDGPAGSRTRRSTGATGARVNARRCETPRAGAIDKKSRSLLRDLSFTLQYKFSGKHTYQ
jgi:hypothetical protein